MEWIIGIPLGIWLGKTLFGDDDKKSNNNQNNNYKRQFSKEIEDLRKEKREIEIKNNENLYRIMELMKQMNAKKEDQERNDLHKEIERIEKNNHENIRNIEAMNKRQRAIEKCKNELSDEFNLTIWKTINNFISERDKWLEELLSDENLNIKLNNLKNELSLLFNKLFDNQKIFNKIDNIFINLFENNVNKVNMKELNKMNFMVIGTAGVGKSTLINQLLGDQLAEEGMGKRCTTKTKRYESKYLPFISLTDTVGTEIGKEYNLDDVEKDTLNEINEKLNNNDPNEHIHGIIYCTTSNRFFKDELKLLLKIRERYDGKKLPIVIVYTQANNNKEANAMKDAINEFLNEYGEKISDDDDDDDFGINFIKVRAREKKYKRMGQEFIDPCFGLSKLISTCYKKCKKIYQVPIKNSLIKIGKNKIIEYVNKIAINIQNNINFYLFLQYNFQHNFYEYIAYSFEKIANIENLNEINFLELNNLYNYLKIKNPEKNDNNIINDNKNNYNYKNIYNNETNDNNYNYQNNNNEKKHNTSINIYNSINFNNNHNIYNDLFNNNNDNKNNNLNENEKKIYSGEKLCIFCVKKPNKSFVCDFCGLYICEYCYLKTLQEEEKVICKCNCESFNYCEEEQDTNNNTINEKNNYNNNNDNYQNNNNNGTDDNNYNYQNNNNEDNDKIILKNNLNIESKKLVNEYIEKFRNELINFIGKKFDEFTLKASKEIYYQISDKFLEIVQKENMNMNEAMKSPEQLQLEATNFIKKELKETSEEMFLTKNSSSLYHDIISIFEKEMINKIDDYINNLNNNTKFLNFIQFYDIFKEGKNLKIEDDFNDYIKTLKRNEYESMEKSANLQYGGSSQTKRGNSPIYSN